MHNLKIYAQSVLQVVLEHTDLAKTVGPTKQLRNWNYKENQGAMSEKRTARSECCCVLTSILWSSKTKYTNQYWGSRPPLRGRGLMEQGSPKIGFLHPRLILQGGCWRREAFSGLSGDAQFETKCAITDNTLSLGYLTKKKKQSRQVDNRISTVL